MTGERIESLAFLAGAALSEDLIRVWLFHPQHYLPPISCCQPHAHFGCVSCGEVSAVPVAGTEEEEEEEEFITSGN